MRCMAAELADDGRRRNSNPPPGWGVRFRTQARKDGVMNTDRLIIVIGAALLLGPVIRLMATKRSHRLWHRRTS